MITAVNAFLAAKGIYLLTLMLLSLGVAGIIVCNNYMKKLICMNVMQVAVIFFFLCLGQKYPGTIPVAVEGLTGAAEYINPLPHGLMLTAIVVSLGTTGVGLSLLLRIKEKYGTIEEDDLLKRQAVQAERDKKRYRGMPHELHDIDIVHEEAHGEGIQGSQKKDTHN